MQYELILVRYGEMTTKGKNRKKFITTLKDNVKNRLKEFSNLEIDATRDRMYIYLNGEDHEPVAKKLQTVFGIHNFSLALKTETDFEKIKEGVLKSAQDFKEAKTFKISVKRSYKQFPMETNELQMELGAHVLINTEHLTVDVRKPELNIRVEIRSDATYVMSKDYQGAGGYPTGVGGKVLLLLSGGIDSPVAGYLAMKRGVNVEAIHFYSPPFTSERAKQKVLDLAAQLTSYCRNMTVHVVPFTEVQKAIHKHVPSQYEMTVMRRMMMRIAERVAEQRGAMALATGESLGQVASQTLDSMHTINEVTNYPIIRPVITMDKLEIIDIATKIETYDISIRPYEDCCTIFTPANPATKPKREKAARFEENFDWEPLLEEAVNGVESIGFRNGAQKIKDEFADLL